MDSYYDYPRAPHPRDTHRPYDPYAAEKAALQRRLNDLEHRRNGYYPPPPAYDTPPPANQKSAPTAIIVPVSSPEEAWAYSADYTGEKQIFYDAVNGAFYLKWFDFNEAEPRREVYKLVKSDKTPIHHAPGEQPTAQSPEQDTQQRDLLSLVVDSIDNLESKLNRNFTELKEMMFNASNLNASSVEVDASKVSGRPTDNGKGDGAGSK